MKVTPGKYHLFVTENTENSFADSDKKISNSEETLKNF